MEWVIIKGISDYADGSKSKTEAWRPFASVMAASVVDNILKVPGLLKDWPHYKGVNQKQEGKLHIYVYLVSFLITLSVEMTKFVTFQQLFKSQILKETYKNRAPI